MTSRLHPVSAAAAPELIECLDCEGSGELPCCIAYDVGESGPRGCRCARPGMQPCDACDGVGYVEPDDEEDDR